MRILLLGAEGQLGSHLRRTLPSVGEVVASSRLGGESAISCDLGDRTALARLLADASPDLVVNAAAYTAVDRAEEDPTAALAINAGVPRALGEAVASWGGAVIHFSTDYVFAGDSDRPYSESDPTAPLGTYGQSKLDGEIALAASGVDHLILRTAWVYSLQGRNFLSTMLRLAREKDQVRVVDDQHGTPTSAGFLAEATALIAARWMANPGDRSSRSGVFHLTADGETTWHGFARRIFAEAASNGLMDRAPKVVPISTSEFPTSARRPVYSVLCHEKVKRTFGISPPDWQDDLHEVMNSLKGN